MKDKKGN